VIRYLVEEIKININLIDTYNTTGFLNACYHPQDFELIKYISTRSYVHARDDFGYNALLNACAPGYNTKYTKCIGNDNCKCYNCDNQIYIEKLKIIKYLIEELKINMYMRVIAGNKTILQLACESQSKNNYPIIQYLLSKYNISHNDKIKTKYTP